MFEMGYAIGVNKPVIVMVQRGIQPPVDLRGRLYFQYSVEELELIPELLDSYIKSAIEASIAEKQKCHIISGVSPTGDSLTYKNKAKSAHSRFEVLTTNLESFNSSGMADIVKERMKKCENIKS
jgi:hypothetical protein